MSVQNPYNNYISRTTSKKNTGNFKQKVANSLSGKATNIPTGVPSNTVVQTPPTPQARANPQAPVVTSPPIKPTPGVNTPIVPQNPTQGQPQPPVPNPEVNGMGMMSLSDVNGAFTQSQAGQPVGGMNPAMARANSSDNNIVPGTNMTRAEYEAEVKRKQQAGISLDKPYIPKTPQEMAQDILEDQKSQAQKDWELKQQMLEEQLKNANSSFEQSKKDAENAYGQTVDKMNENRYQQMEDLNVSGGMRGIQYSPQQLGLENVANINHNKNLAQASTERNELLNKLQIETNKVIAELNMGMMGATNEYNKTIGNLQADYMNKLMGWEWDKQMTEEERKWQEAQAQKDKDFQKEMDRLDKEWQANQNQLDRDKYNRSSGGGGGSYGGYSGRSYGAYGGGNSGDYGVQYSNQDLSDETNALAYEKTFKDASSDMFDAVNSNTSPFNSSSRMDAYKSEMDDMVEYARQNGANSDTMENLYGERDRSGKQLFENFGDLVNYENNLEARERDRVKFNDKYMSGAINTRSSDREKYSLMMRDAKTKKKEEFSKKPKQIQHKEKSIEKSKSKTKDKVKKELSKNTSNSTKSQNVPRPSKNTKKKVAQNSAKNANVNSKSAFKNTKKAVSNAKKNSKKAKSNSWNNLKKNVKKAFSKKKKKKKKR